ncbi:hypothetical protein, partial, partial [Parasitella parasitica]
MSKLNAMDLNLGYVVELKQMYLTNYGCEMDVSRLLRYRRLKLATTSSRSRRDQNKNYLENGYCVNEQQRFAKKQKGTPAAIFSE